MIGFYLATQNDSSSGIKLLSESFDSFVETNELSDNSLYVFDNHSASVVRSNNYTLYVIGTLIYKNRWNNDALKLISDGLSSGITLKDIALNTRGQYCLIIHTHGNVFVITDKLGSFPIYRYEKNNSLQISNILPLLSTRNSITLNFQGLAEFMSLNDAFCFDTTFFKEIQPLHGGTIYQFSPKQTSPPSDIVYYDILDDITLNKYQDLNEVSNTVREILSENLSFLRTQDKIFIDVTGGFDSRVNAAILNNNGIEYVSGICSNKQTLNELQIASKVAHRLNVEFYDNFNKIESYDRFKDIVHKHYNISNGVPQLYYSTDLINYYDNIKRNYNIHVTGMVGSQLFRRKGSLEGTIIDNKIDIDKYLKTNFKYLNLINDRYITKGSYYGNLREKVEKIIGRIRGDDFFNLLMLIELMSYGRCHHGSAIGTHNCILPHYSPYMEANLVKVMFETSSSLKYEHNIQREILSKINPAVASVMTTHGYKAVRSSGLFSKRFLRTKKIAKEIKNKGMSYLRSCLGCYSTSDDPVYWIQEARRNYSDNMKIFEIVDKVKFEDLLHNNRNNNRFMAKIVYLNKIIEEYGPNIG